MTNVERIKQHSDKLNALTNREWANSPAWDDMSPSQQEDAVGLALKQSIRRDGLIRMIRDYGYTY